MKSELVVIASLIIIVKASLQWFFYARKDRAQTIERDAVVAEFYDYRDRGLSGDEMEQRQKFHRERQAELKMRYPQHLIPEPDVRYLHEAEMKEKKSRPSFKETLLVPTILIALYWLYRWFFT